MNKLMRPVAAWVAAAALAAGALLAAGGSATAATLPPVRHLPVEVTAAVGAMAPNGYHVRQDQGCDWRGDRLGDRCFGAYGWCTGRCGDGEYRMDARFHPWVADQLTLFASYGDLTGRHGVQDRDHDVRGSRPWWGGRPA
ncbi:hypothetical protein ACWDA7_28235 [Streptomyces sp. NPDC001156]